MKTKVKLSVDILDREVSSLLCTVGVERARYKDVPIDDWTERVRALEKARGKLWVLKTFSKDKDVEVMDLTREEWHAAALAAELELTRWSGIKQEHWSNDVASLRTAGSKIMKFLSTPL